MSQEKSEQPREESAADESGATENNKRSADPVRKWTLATLAVIALLLAWYLGADRFTPFTSQARVDAYVVPIAPQVTGNVLSVEVENNQVVAEGDILLTLDDSRYRLAVVKARADLESAQQELGASSAGVESAEAAVQAAQAELVRSRRDFERMRRIRTEEPGAISQRRLDLAEASLRAAESRVASARAEVERARQQRGRKGSITHACSRHSRRSTRHNSNWTGPS